MMMMLGVGSVVCLGLPWTIPACWGSPWQTRRRPPVVLLLLLLVCLWLWVLGVTCRRKKKEQTRPTCRSTDLLWLCFTCLPLLPHQPHIHPIASHTGHGEKQLHGVPWLRAACVLGLC